MGKTTFKAMAADNRFITLSEGNKKLKPNKDVKFLIFNLPSVITCPFANGCKKYCYAKKAEQAYPTCLPSRMKHFEESKQADFVERMIYTIEAHLTRQSYKTAKKVVVRIHESGDFYNASYMIKWFDIANHFKHNKKVVFMAYTKSAQFYQIAHEFNHPCPLNMVVRFSVWGDTSDIDLNFAKRWNLPTYSAVEKFDETIPSQNRCRCADCATCGKCWGKTKALLCEIH